MMRLCFLAGLGALAWPQMPPGLAGRDSYAIRKVDPKAPCRFAAEYERIKGTKTDPRVAYIEADALVAGEDDPLGFEARCRQLSGQTEDGIVFHDRPRGFLHLIFGSPRINTQVAYFAGTGGAHGVMLYVARWDDESKAYALGFRGGQWRDVTAEFLGPLRLQPEELLLLPQYGRTVRVLKHKDDGLVHSRYLSWNGRALVALPAKTGKASWRCPETYRYWEPAERAVYCR